MQRAQDLKSYRIFSQGTKSYTFSFAYESNISLLEKSKCVNIFLGPDNRAINENIEN